VEEQISIASIPTFLASSYRPTPQAVVDPEASRPPSGDLSQHRQGLSDDLKYAALPGSGMEEDEYTDEQVETAKDAAFMEQSGLTVFNPQEQLGSGEAAENGEVPDLGLAEDSPEKIILRESIGHDIYKEAISSAALASGQVPRRFRPRTGSSKEEFDMHFNFTREYWMRRDMHRDKIHEQGWAAHHAMRRDAVNVYANTRRVAGLMTAFEADDFRLQNHAPSNIAPWARAEIVFEAEYPKFNEYLRQHADELVKRMPREAEEEDIDLMDEALFLQRPDDDNAAEERARQQSAELDLVAGYLEGTLPGATLDSLAATYADDIFDADDYASDDEFSKAPEAEVLAESNVDVDQDEVEETAEEPQDEGEEPQEEGEEPQEEA